MIPDLGRRRPGWSAVATFRKKPGLLFLLLVFLVGLGVSPAPGTVQGAGSGTFFFLPLAYRNSERIAWMGPEGGTITALAVSPQQLEVVFAGTWGAGVYKSKDGGGTWHPSSTGLGNLYINSLAVDPKDPQVVYAGTYKGKLYKSLDGGGSWSFSSQGVQEEAIVYAIAIDPLNTHNLYIATRGVSNQSAPPWSGVVYKSIDAGSTWTPSLTDVGGANLQDWVYSLSIHPRAPHIIYSAAHEQGPYRSMDAGATWEVVENGVTDTSGRAIVVDPLSNVPGVVYFGVWHGGGVFKTSDGGESWSQISEGVYGNKVYNIAIDPLKPETLFLGTFTAGVMKTLESGASWFNSGLYNEAIFTLAVNPGDPQVVYAGTVGNGLYKSLTGGAGWALSQKGLKGSPLTAWIVDGAIPKKYYASSLELGVVTSADSGRAWQDYNTGLPERTVNALVQHPSSPAVLYALTVSSGLYRRQVDASNWAPVGEGLPTLPESSAVDMGLVAAFPDIADGRLETARTTNFAPLLALAFAPSNNSVLYIGSNGMGVYKSLDGGAHWMSAGLLGEKVRQLAVDSLNPGKLYALTEDTGELQISEDGGDSWVGGGITGRVIHDLVLLEGTPDAVIAGTDQGVYRLTDSEWTQSGLSALSVLAIAVQANQPGRIFAGTGSGAYISRDGGASWQPVTPELTGIPVQVIISDPHDDQVVYFVTATRGVLRVELPSETIAELITP